jgi:hypothetical protein
MDLVVIVCHYNRNLEWLSNIKYPNIVYNKNPENNSKFENNLPNVGFDTIAYLTYMIDNYENLPDYVCFSQDYPFDHCPSFIEKVNGFDFKTEFYPLGCTYIRDGNELEKTIEYANRNNISYNQPIKFISSAQCIVSKKLILKNSLEYYKKIKETLSKTEIINQTNYCVEYLWPTILNFNEELNLSLNNC